MVIEAPIEIVSYDGSWLARFADEREALVKVLRPWLSGPIEHVGSTAVPGLAAKPVIDIMAGVETLEASRAAIARLEASGYCYAPYKPEVMHWFCKPSPQLRTHHLHLVPVHSARWVECLRFRDALRADAELARAYAAVKIDLAARFGDDREAYTQAKAPFIRAVLAGATSPRGPASSC
jgi:GrpB-like predicted nucleotidyltransferase (UPF0157 family)